jgi:hypothetical protein
MSPCRALAAMMLITAAQAVAAAPGDGEDDPKLARAASPPPRVVLADEDDPKLARGAPRRRLWPRITHAVPRFKLAYRYLSVASLTGGTEPLHAAALDFYPVSNLVRLGIGTEVGFSGDSYGTWFLTEGLSLGVQWPARVTPFVDGRFVAGLVGANVLGHQVVSYIYAGGIDGGIEVYYLRRFFVTVAVGWVHPVYRGVDLAQVQAHPTAAPPGQDFAADTFTLKVGLGL